MTTQTATQPLGRKLSRAQADAEIAAIGQAVLSGDLPEEAGRRQIAEIFVSSDVGAQISYHFRARSTQDMVDLADSGRDLVLDKLLNDVVFYDFNKADGRKFSSWVFGMMLSAKPALEKKHRIVQDRYCPVESVGEYFADNQEPEPMFTSTPKVETEALKSLEPEADVFEEFADQSERFLKRYRSREERIYVCAQFLHRKLHLPPLVRPTDAAERLAILARLREEPKLAHRSLLAFYDLIQGREIPSDIGDDLLALWDDLSFTDVKRLLTSAGAKHIAVVAEAAVMQLLIPAKTAVKTMQSNLKNMVTSNDSAQWKKLSKDLFDSFLAKECEPASRHSPLWNSINEDEDIHAKRQIQAGEFNTLCQQVIDFSGQPLGETVEEITGVLIDIWEEAYHRDNLSKTFAEVIGKDEGPTETQLCA
ncbi:hypothetical protein [Brevibacterium picturae]|uniref:Uncharacterized protein n=1 Tax=Brevibacterium picturae TaxID=260553 RepID=A0ABP4MJZ6_9MICO